MAKLDLGLAPWLDLGRTWPEPGGPWPDLGRAPADLGGPRPDLGRAHGMSTIGNLVGNPEITNYQFNSKINQNAVKYSVFADF